MNVSSTPPDRQLTRRALPSKFGSYLGLDSVAATLQVCDTHLVHGLLRTPDYARALLRGERPELLDHEIDALVDLRMKRQEILTHTIPPAPTLWSIMAEAVLRRQIGGPETMYAQLLRLIERSSLSNATLLVISDDLGAHPGLSGPTRHQSVYAAAIPRALLFGSSGRSFLVVTA